ncbi:MAG: lipoic acid synthetase [Chloroflexi bacterium]|nr:lipoic acid synthetase [Chloroflexota bacterium]
MSEVAARRPDWLKVRVPGGPNYVELKTLMRDLDLHTVCEEARCPNMGECWEHRTATFMILGDICTRACGFCAVTSGKPMALDLHEPQRVARAVQQMGLRHVVITSVNRDDLSDGGSVVFAATIRKVREANPGCTIEVLIPDFEGVEDSLNNVMRAAPDILNHNIETVERLTKRVRRRAQYRRSLAMLLRAKQIAPGRLTKSGIMLGLTETDEEIEQTLRDLRASQVDVVTIGQYLRPSAKHLPVDRFYTPAEFERWRDIGMSMGFRHVESGPLVRSSYHAHEHATLLPAGGQPTA